MQSPFTSTSVPAYFRVLGILCLALGPSPSEPARAQSAFGGYAVSGFPAVPGHHAGSGGPAVPGDPTVLGHPGAESTAVQVERVALFKNGLGFFTSRVTVPAGAIHVDLGSMPTPAHGTLWVTHDGTTPVRGVFTRRVEAEEERPAASISDLLAANIGRSLTLEPAGTPGESISGELISATAGLAILRTPEGTIALDPRSVARVAIQGAAVEHAVRVETLRSVLRLELEGPAARDATVELTYLAQGITWAPSYRIDLGRAGRARLESKAVVVNEATELEDVHLDLVTGFPHLLFDGVRTPLDLDQSLDSFFHALAGQGQGRADPNVMTQRVAFNHIEPRRRGAGSSTLAGGIQPGAEGTAEDLFFYPLPPISLGEGERAMLPILEAEVPYEHVYTWEIPDFFDPRQHRYAEPEADREEVVWHVARLANTTGMPLTTAPAQFVRDGRIVGQDTLGYTHPGAEADVRINRALGLVAEQAEIETDRQPLEERLHGSAYDRITIRGELKLHNRLGKGARIEVSKSLTGEIDSGPGGGASADGALPEITRTTRGLRAANPTHRLDWAVDLAAGESRTLSYVYEVLVRR